MVKVPSLPEFDEDTVRAAIVLIESDAVDVEGMKMERGHLLIYGKCRDHGRRVYRVNVWLVPQAGAPVPQMTSICACPRHSNCEHVLAMIQAGLEIATTDRMSRPQQLIEAVWLALPIGGKTSASAEGGAVRPSSLTRKWLAGLDAAPPEPPPSDFALVYILDDSDMGSLTVAKSRRLKRGGLGKPSPLVSGNYYFDRLLDNEYVTEADVGPLRLYLGLLLTQGKRYIERHAEVELDEQFGPDLLERAAATGRLFLVGNMERPLTLAEPQPLTLCWRFGEDGRQHLAIDLPPGRVFLPGPLWYVDPGNAVLGRLTFAYPVELLRHLLQAPPLDENDALIVAERLAHLPRPPQTTPLPLPASDAVHETLGTPRAHLRLRLGRFRHQALASIDETWPLAELWFDYGEGLVLAGGEETTPLVRVERAGRWCSLQRDMGYERALWQRLADWGLLGLGRRLPAYRRVDAAVECLLPARNQAAGWLPLLEEGVVALEQEGVAVEFDDDFPFRISAAEDWFVALDETPEAAGWFDLDLGVVIDGERVSLVPPLLAMLKAQPELPARLKTMEETATVPLAIDARRIVPVPAGRLRAWVMPLLEFLDDDRPRLQRHHAAALAACDDGTTQWLGGEALRALGEKLRNFAGLSPLAPAEGFNATLRPYQALGLAWLQFLREHGLAGILADDMGLGKTVQTLGHLHLEKHAGRADLPSLVIAPTSLMANWRNEAAQFAPNLTVLTLHGPERAHHFDQIASADLVLTTYPLLVRDAEVLRAQRWHLLILDEAQFIKNPKAQAHQVARQLDARHRLSLTGTPLENHLGELWAHFDFLMPGFLGNGPRFTRVFRTPIEKQNDVEARNRLHERVRPFLLRRTKEQVLAELPPRSEIVRWIEIEGGQRDLYESLRIAFDKKLREVLAEQGVGRSQIMILDALLKLRQVCCDPRLVKLPSAEALVKSGKAVSAKLNTLLEMLDELLDEGRRILLFSQFTSMLGLIEKELNKHKIAHVKLTGDTRDRETPIRRFQEGEVPLFLISLKAGGTGLNLTAADTVIHYDPWWNPAVEEQATARAHRLGQEKPVFVYKLLTQGTVEEKIQQLQQRKRHLTSALVQAGGEGEGGGHLLTADDLDVLFQPLE